MKKAFIFLVCLAFPASAFAVCPFRDIGDSLESYIKCSNYEFQQIQERNRQYLEEVKTSIDLDLQKEQEKLQKRQSESDETIKKSYLKRIEGMRKQNNRLGGGMEDMIQKEIEKQDAQTQSQNEINNLHYKLLEVGRKKNALETVSDPTFTSVERVSGHSKKNGTWVSPYYRTKRDNSISNNFSTKGNTNPFTAKKGTVTNCAIKPCICPLGWKVEGNKKCIKR